MDSDSIFEGKESRVNFMNPPESSAPGGQDFSAKTQQNQFLGGGSGSKLGENTGLLGVLRLSRVDIKKPRVEGRSNLPSVPCVVATTHLSDIDVQEVAMEVARDRKIGIVSQATNLEFPVFKPFVAAIGKENFFRIENTIGNGSTSYSLRSEDFERMRDGIAQEGRTMVIAAHNPTHNWELAQNPGVGAVILAHLARVPLVPAALDIESPTPVGQSTDIRTRVKNFVTRNRPKANMTFCLPIELSEIPDGRMELAINLYSPDKRRAMPDEDRRKAQETLDILKKEAGTLMYVLASNISPEKRGEWERAKDN